MKRTPIIITFPGINVTSFFILTMITCFRTVDIVCSCLTTLKSTKIFLTGNLMTKPFNTTMNKNYESKNSENIPKICTSLISKAGTLTSQSPTCGW